jgi:hypothetical protein
MPSSAGIVVVRRKCRLPKKKKQFRWPKATSPLQELEVLGAERPKLLVYNNFKKLQQTKFAYNLF